MKNVYIQNEAKNNFRNWTKQGLEFLLLYPWLNKKVTKQIQTKLKGENK